MSKYSIVIPVYNVDAYLEKCLDSVVNQTYKDIEVIIVNDGSTDNSKDIIDKYAKKYNFIKVINQKNMGLSMARNNGIKEVTSPYFILLDSDDYIDKDLIEILDEEIKKGDVDLLRYQIRTVNNDEAFEYHEKEFVNLSGYDAFNEIVKYSFVEVACLYLYRTKYFNDNKFLFAKDKYHEDFGLIPLVIYKANSVSSIDKVGYNYVVRENSIMNNSNYNKTLKKVDDFYFHYKYLIKELGDDDKIIKSFLANSLILKITELNKDDYKKYFKRLKDDRVFDNVLSDTLIRKIKKILVKISPKLYYKRRK